MIPKFGSHTNHTQALLTVIKSVNSTKNAARDAALKMVSKFPKNPLARGLAQCDAFCLWLLSAYAIQQTGDWGPFIQVTTTNHDEPGVPSYFLLLRKIGLGW